MQPHAEIACVQIFIIQLHLCKDIMSQTKSQRSKKAHNVLQQHISSSGSGAFNDLHPT